MLSLTTWHSGLTLPFPSPFCGIHEPPHAAATRRPRGRTSPVPTRVSVRRSSALSRAAPGDLLAILQRPARRQVQGPRLNLFPLLGRHVEDDEFVLVGCATIDA